MRKILTLFSALVLIALTVFGLPAPAAAAVEAVLAPSLASVLDIDTLALGLVGVGLVVNRQSVDLAFQGFKTIFNDAFMGAKSMWEVVAMLSPSSTLTETYGWLGDLPGFREWIGDRVIHGLKTHGFSIENKPYELTVGIKRDDFEDDRLGVYRPIVAELGRQAKVHPDILIWALLASGFATACYDGQYFFDTDHPVLDADGNETSVSNFGGGAGTAWYLMDLSRMVKPLIFQRRKDYEFVQQTDPADESVFMRKEFRMGVDTRVAAGFGLWQLAYASKDTLNATNYGAARAAMQSLVGDYGKKLGITPTHLIVPPSLEEAGRKILNATEISGGGTNVWQNTAELVVVPWL